MIYNASLNDVSRARCGAKVQHHEFLLTELIKLGHLQQATEIKEIFVAQHPMSPAKDVDIPTQAPGVAAMHVVSSGSLLAWVLCSVDPSCCVRAACTWTWGPRGCRTLLNGTLRSETYLQNVSFRKSTPPNYSTTSESE